jgi:hypothetical protein
MDGRLSQIKPLFSNGPVSPIEPFFHAKPLSPSIQSKVKYQVTRFQQEVNVFLLTNDRPSIQSKVKSQVTKVQQEIKMILVTNDQNLYFMLNLCHLRIYLVLYK